MLLPEHIILFAHSIPNNNSYGNNKVKNNIILKSCKDLLGTEVRLEFHELQGKYTTVQRSGIQNGT